MTRFQLAAGAALALLAGAAGGAGAQLYSFGKNKVQYDQFSWRKMETPHFDLYFYPEEEELAGYAARMAEAGYYDLSTKLGHAVRRRIPVILYSSHVYFEQTNVIPGLMPEGVAGFTEFLKGRVVLPLSGSYPEFERVLRHELVHVFTFDRIRHVLRSRGQSEFRPAPLWLSEGLAEYWSGEWDSYGEMILRDALFAERLVPIAAMHRIDGTFQMYKEGESLCAFMASRYGPDVFARLLDNWWRSEDFAEVFELTAGESLARLDEEWLYHLRKEYLPDIGSADAPSQAATALTREGYNLKPALVPGAAAAGDSAAFLHFQNQRGYTRIVRSDLSGAAPRVVVEGERSPRYESLHPLGASLDVSADGRWLAFAAKSRGRDRLYLWDLEKGRLDQKLSFEAVVSITSPTWSPDGRRLAFAGARPDGEADLYCVDVASGQLQALTADLYDDRDPDWGPEGSGLVFSSDRWAGGRKGEYNLFHLDPDNGRIRPLTQGPHSDLQPAWSPDGEWIAFASDRDRMYDLYALRLAAGAEPQGTVRLSRILTGAFDPAWLPGGGGLLFTGYEAASFQVYRLDLPGGSPTRAVAEAPTEAGAPIADEGWGLSPLAGELAVTRSEYRKELSLDVAQSQISQDPVFGTSGGVLIGLSDVLGNDQYYFVLSHIAGSNTNFFNGLNLAFGRLLLGRQLNVGWGCFRLNDRYTSTFGRYVREKRTGGYVELSYPFSRHDRLELRTSMRHADIDRDFEGRQKVVAWLVSNYAAYTHDSSLWIPTGPLEGTRYSLGVGQNVDLRTSRRYNTTTFADYRRYVRLSKRSSLAMRYMASHSRGDLPEYFALGGSWTLRGYPWRSIWGRNLVLLNHELRYPLVDRLVLAFPFGSIDFSSFRGALFLDAGNAWSDQFGHWRGSLGAGVRVALGGVFVLRLDAARRTDFSSIDNDTHWEFFFGWDY
ncbi:MAG: BamA/TamA family outer membrane protein [Gemmatimonadota bacterium]